MNTPNNEEECGCMCILDWIKWRCHACKLYCTNTEFREGCHLSYGCSCWVGGNSKKSQDTYTAPSSATTIEIQSPRPVLAAPPESPPMTPQSSARAAPIHQDMTEISLRDDPKVDEGNPEN